MIDIIEREGTLTIGDSVQQNILHFVNACLGDYKGNPSLAGCLSNLLGDIITPEGLSNLRERFIAAGLNVSLTYRREDLTLTIETPGQPPMTIQI